MLDSINPANLPAGADAYAGYVDGAWPTYATVRAMFPAAHVLPVAVLPSDDAEACDCETGDLTVAQVPGWVGRQLRRGVWRPVVYASAGIMSPVIAQLSAAGIGRSEVRLWSAHYTVRHICAPPVCGYPAADGTQWRDNAPGLNGSLIDESLLSAGFFGPAQAGHLLPEEPMLLNKGAGARTPMALPNGTARVRFFASQTATIEVDLRHQGTANPTLTLEYASAKEVRIPAGVHAIVVHRIDSSDHDVSAVPST
jgi:hypothetical protein